MLGSTHAAACNILQCDQFGSRSVTVWRGTDLHMPPEVLNSVAGEMPGTIQKKSW